MRAPFTDNFNSVSHVAFGAIGYQYPVVLLMFCAYQLVQGGGNMAVDLAEGFAGYALAFLLQQ